MAHLIQLTHYMIQIGMIFLLEPNLDMIYVVEINFLIKLRKKLPCVTESLRTFRSAQEREGRAHAEVITLTFEKDNSETITFPF